MFTNLFNVCLAIVGGGAVAQHRRVRRRVRHVTERVHLDQVSYKFRMENTGKMIINDLHVIK